MRYRISITEVDDGESNPGNVIVRYEQTVDQLDIQAVINAVNSTPQPQRLRALRSDAGKPRPRKEEEVI